MLIPIGHEQTSARRVPIITFAIIAFNCIVFLFTNADSSLERESHELATLRVHIRILAATAPELTMTPAEQQVVADFRDHFPNQWRQLSDPKREPYDAWDVHIRLVDDPKELQDEMNSLAQQYTAALSSSAAATQFAFVPAHPTLISYFTSTFMHGGWIHLISNMWFLWLAGFVLEDTWGRVLYPVFYLVAGAVASQVHAWANPGSNIPTIGASGAVAALMGAFLIRFPKMRIQLWGWIAFRIVRFGVPAWVLLPFWFLLEVFYGALTGDLGGGGVAHWAHVGGFAFGAIVALALSYSGLEHTVGKAVDKQVGVVSNKEISQASELLERGKLDEARDILNAMLAKKSDSVDALGMLREIHRRRGDDPGYLDTTAKLCAAHLREKNFEAAWHEYQDYQQAGGGKLPAAVWLSLCRGLEEQQNFEGALAEYEKLIAAYPTERQSLMAQLQAAGLCLKRLNRPQDALKFYEAAATSPIPHLDLDATIQLGIKSANNALTRPRASSATLGG
jgi:membrane associated rhomboid family serine protease